MGAERSSQKKKHFRENKEIHLFVSSSFLKIWHYRPPSFHFFQTCLITCNRALLHKDSVLKFIGEVCHCSPVLCFCQRVSSHLLVGTVILKTSMTDLMLGQFLIPLLCAAGPFMIQTLLLSLRTTTTTSSRKQAAAKQGCGESSVRDIGALRPEFQGGIGGLLPTTWAQARIRRITFKIRQALLLSLILVS